MNPVISAWIAYQKQFWAMPKWDDPNYSEWLEKAIELHFWFRELKNMKY